MIVGTAGHIDHGKTTLVRALTGIDTDRLKEEKARGISIELGYAYTPLANGDVLGYVDVPGHERLVHTMAAGASGIDFALLVIAADDGVMPQTCEHVAILDLLGVTRGAVALTKTDRVDMKRRTQVRRDIDNLLAATPFAGAAVFPVNATASDDPGIAALRAHLHEAARHLPPRRADGLFRLAVDRVFTLAGHGTVITGTVVAGQVRTGDTVRVGLSGLPVRVRGIHAQNRPAGHGRAGQRCALNLVGARKEDVARGDWVVDPVLAVPVSRVDVSMTLLRNAGLRVTNWASLYVHVATARRLAHIVPLDSGTIEPGGTARAQLIFEAPLCTVPGDRFIVRNPQATRTVGGGRVLDPFAPERRRRSAQRLAYLAALQQLVDGAGVAPLLAQAAHGIGFMHLMRLTGQRPGTWLMPPDALILGTGRQSGEACIILASQRDAAEQKIVSALGAFHARLPDEPGPDAERLRRIAFAAQPGLPDTLWYALLHSLIERGDIRRDGPWIHLPSHAIILSDNETALTQRILPMLAAGRCQPPWVRDLSKNLGVTEETMRQLLRKLARQGTLYQVVHDLFYPGSQMLELADVVAALAAQHDGLVDAARFRDAVGLGRKRAIQILEFFDRVGYTRRVGEVRRLRPGSRWCDTTPT